jgi:hypothetical protein
MRLSKDDAGVEAPHCRVLERESNWEEVTMKIDSTTFGTITIDGKTYEHDVVVRLSGEVVKRKKKLSKKLYGTSHVLSEDEARFLFEKGCDQVVIGSGQGNVHLSPEAEASSLEKRHVLFRNFAEGLSDRKDGVSDQA